MKRDMNLQGLLKSWGFERIKNKFDLPKDYIPYDYKNDLKSKLLSNWNDEKLKIILEQLSNFNNEVYIDTDSYFYYRILLQANLKNMDVNKLINLLGYKRVLKKEKDTEQKLISVKNLKDLYQGKCQLCGGDEPQIPIILKSNGDIYSEVHHIKSFSNIQSNNDDITEIDNYRNTLVLCPYHHKVVHFKNKGFKKLTFLDNGEVYLAGEDDEKIKLNLNYHISEY